MKRTMSILLSSVLLLSVIFCCPIYVGAAEAGTLPSNAIYLNEGEMYYKYWTNQNYKLNCYNRISIPSRGYIIITMEKPYDSEGEVSSFKLYMYDEDGNDVWSCNTKPQEDTFSEYYVYKVGLDRGTYYLNIKPNFYVYSNSAPIDAGYKYNFYADNYWEIEPNNSQTTATQLTLNKMFSGVYADESYDSSYMDYYSINLTKGVSYTINIDNYEKLDAGTLILKLVDPSGTENSLYGEKMNGTTAVFDIKPVATGKYYVKFYNDGNDKGTEYKIGVKNVKPQAPTVAKVSGLKASKVKTNEITLKWSSAKNADQYKVYRSTDGSTWTKITTTSKLTYTDKSVKAGKKYQYRVKGYHSASKTNGEYSSVLKTGTLTAAPKISSLKSTKAKTATVKWGKVTGAKSYIVYTSKDNSKWTKAVSTTKTNATLSKLAAGKKVFVKIYAVNAYGKSSAASAVKSVKVIK